MTTPTRTAIAAAAAALLILPPAVSADPSDASPEEIALRTADLDTAEAKWTAAGHRDYSFRIERLCFCSLEYTRRVRIRVVDGHPSGGGAPYRKINEVQELFDFVRGNLDDDELYVKYGAKLGVPKAIDTNPSFNTFDEEMSYRVDRFHVGG
jgi:hypothetical protein